VDLSRLNTLRIKQGGSKQFPALLDGSL